MNDTCIHVVKLRCFPSQEYFEDDSDADEDDDDDDDDDEQEV